MTDSFIAKAFTKYYLFLAFILYFILSLLFLHIPFFWDSTHFSAIGLYYYENNFSSLIPPAGLDSGHPPLFGLYLAAGWKFFGKSLLVSHLLMLPLAYGIFYFFDKIAGKYLDHPLRQLALLFLVFDSALLTQTIFMGYDLLMICAYIAALHYLLEKKRAAYAIALIILIFSNSRGILMFFSLAVIDVLINWSKENFSITRVTLYLHGILLFILWLYYHEMQTGWMLVSPNDTGVRSIVGPGQFFKNLFYVLWKNADFGRIVLWLTVLGFYIFSKKKFKFTEPVLFVIVPLLILSIATSALSNPIGHKYFMIVFVFLILAFFAVIRDLNSDRIRIFITVFSFLILISGNWWYYSFKYGNSWDTTMKSISYFELEERLDKFLREEGISKKNVAAVFPLSTDRELMYLKEEKEHFMELNPDSVTEYPYVLESNICNNYSKDKEKKLAKLQPVKDFRKGRVYIRLYKKPN